jgi:hypothetical protein
MEIELMSVRALDWVLSVRVRSAAGPAAKLILFALADESDDTGTCCCSDQLIAAKCEVSEKVVRRTICRLVEANYLDVEPAPEMRLAPATKRYRLAINAGPAVSQVLAQSTYVRPTGRSHHPRRH